MCREFFICRNGAPRSASEAERASSRVHRIGLLLGLVVALSACQRTSPAPAPAPASVAVVAEPAWRASASAEDAARIDGLQGAWDEALARARRSGFARQIAAEGALLQPDAALAQPAPTPGNYQCRWIRFGSGEGRARAFTAYRSFFCHIGAEEDSLSLTKQTGSDRPSGYLFDSDNRKMVFLGSLALGNDDTPRAYGEDPSRDMAGVFERVGSFRFRLVVPRPRTGAVLEVVELTPAPIQNE